MIPIIPYQTEHSSGISAFMEEIAKEFPEPIFDPDAPAKAPEHYWVAVNEDLPIGTVGIDVISDTSAALCRMFVKPSFRGVEPNVSLRLLHTALNQCKELDLQTVYLGTMKQFKAAQRFYEKQGFEPVAVTDLPENFPLNLLDTIFYRYNLKTLSY